MFKLTGNVAKKVDVAQMFDILSKEFGKLDILVSNAASGVLKPVMELTERQWNWAMDINARALLTLVRHLAVELGEKELT